MRTERLATQAGIRCRVPPGGGPTYRAAGLWPEAAARLEVVVADLGRPAGPAPRRRPARPGRGRPPVRRRPRALATATEAARRFGTQRRWVDRAAALVVAHEATFDLDGGGPPATSEDTWALRRAAEVLRHRGEQERAVAAWLLVGRIAGAAGRPERARQAWAVAGDLAEHGPVLVRVQGHLARALAARGPAERRRACAAGLHQLDAYREGVVSIELRARLAGHGRELSDLALRSLEPAGRSRQLFRWLEAVAVSGRSRPSPPPRRHCGRRPAALRRRGRSGRHDQRDGRRRPRGAAAAGEPDPPRTWTTPPRLGRGRVRRRDPTGASRPLVS